MPGVNVKGPAGAPADSGCYVKQLPDRLRDKALKTALDIYPPNAPGNLVLPKGVIAPQHLTLVTTRYWGPNPRILTVSFMEPDRAGRDFQERILSHMNAWQCSIRFALAPAGSVGDVRISLTGSGFWSYMGTDILLVPNNMPTMNLQNFDMEPRASEYKRVVRHETGHTLGFPHEHLHKAIVDMIDPVKAYKYFWDHGGWDKSMVDNNVLTPLEENAIMHTPVDVISIMCYQLPGEIMKNGKPVPGGSDIDPSDFAFCHMIYPPRGLHQAGADSPATDGAAHVLDGDDWGPENDVDLEAKLKKVTDGVH